MDIGVHLFSSLFLKFAPFSINKERKSLYIGSFLLLCKIIHNITGVLPRMSNSDNNFFFNSGSESNTILL